MVWPNHSTAASWNAGTRSNIRLVCQNIYGTKIFIYFAVCLKHCTSTKALGSVTPYERDFIEKSPSLPTRPNGSSKSGSTTPLAPNWTLWKRNLDGQGMMLIYWLVKISITVERDVKFVSPTIIVNTLPPTQLRVHNETSTGTASSPTSCSTLSSTTSCGTSSCAKRSKRFSSGASTAPAYLYSRRCTARCFTLYAYRANPQRWTFRGAPFRTYFVRSTRILLATTIMHVIATSIPKPRA